MTYDYTAGHTTHTVAQRTGKWQELRTARLTGTRAATVICGTAKERHELREKIIYEIVHNVMTDGSIPMTEHIQRGVDTEDGALKLLQAQLEDDWGDDIEVETPGFITSNGEEWMGCSPDGIFTFKGIRTLIEIKAPAVIQPDTDKTRAKWVTQTIYNAAVCGCEHAVLSQRLWQRGKDGEWEDGGEEHRDVYTQEEISTRFDKMFPVLKEFFSATAYDAVNPSSAEEKAVERVLAQLRESKEEIDVLKVREGLYRGELVAMLQKREIDFCEHGGYSFGKRASKGTPNYKSAYQALCDKHNEDADAFLSGHMGKPSQSWALRRIRKDSKSGEQSK